MGTIARAPVRVAANADLLQRVLGMLPQGKGLPARDWERRHNGLLAVLWLHVVAVPAYGIAEGIDIGHTILEGMALVAAALAAHSGRLSRRLRSGAVSIGLLTASGVLVHFSGGFIEFHFHFFVMIALLSLYVDWFPFLLAVGYVAAHHGVVGVLDPESVYNHPDAIAEPWKWAGIHAAFVLAAGAANVFTWRISEEEARRRENIEHVTEAALAKLPLEGLLDELLVRIARAVGTESAAIWLRQEHGLVLRAAHGALRADGLVTLPLDSGFHAGIIRAGEPAAAMEASELAQLHEVHRSSGVLALAGVPLMVEGELIGVLDVADSRPRWFSPSDLNLLQLVADRVAPAIDRARLYEHEHRIATTLQHSLLPKSLPAIPGVELAARYLPAGAEVAVGGDWYDAVRLPNGRLGLVMGDVAGHGSDAASLMGQLRTALRAYVADGHGPAAVVQRLNSLLIQVEDESMATLLYLEIDLRAGRGELVLAGHPPPLVLAPDGRADYLTAPAAAPLGAWPHSTYRAARVEIERGATIVLYTDGLVERRGESLDAGFAALSERLTAADTRDAEELCDAVLGAATGDPGRADDIAVLVARIEAATALSFRAEYPAEPAAVASVRRELESLLRSAGASAGETYDIVTSTAEACANAVQHAYGLNGGRFHVTAALDNGGVRIEIVDNGSWRQPLPSDGGRGLLLMRGLMDDVDLTRGPAGTSVTMHKTLERVASAHNAA